MSGGNPAVFVDDESGGYGLQPAEHVRDLFISDHHSVVDLLRICIGLDNVPAIFIESDAQDDKATTTVRLLKIDE